MKDSRENEIRKKKKNSFPKDGKDINLYYKSSSRFVHVWSFNHGFGSFLDTFLYIDTLEKYSVFQKSYFCY